MDINRFKIIILITVIILSSILTGLTRFFILPVKGSENGALHTSSIGDIITDKVYNFTVDEPILIFNDVILFEKPYYYDIMVVVVTPHTCDLNITLFDPEDDPYEITYESNMVQDEYRIIPFGTALTGNYTMIFKAILIENLNIHIKIEQGFKCLYDEIAGDELQKLKYYDVRKFKNGTTIVFNSTFKSDWYYKFYFERVSPISKKLSRYVVMEHDIVSSIGIPYRIYRNESLEFRISSVYRFGTAVEGLYIMNITIYCDVPCVNIAFAVVERYRIADEIDPNDDDPPPDIPGNNTSGMDVIIPTAWTIGMIVFVGSAVAIPILIIVSRKKKNPIAI
ncbi:MAG: hypothetical protein ACFE9S_04195 [Candidatus Hermodarchaeota archaeon]